MLCSDRGSRARFYPFGPEESCAARIRPSVSARETEKKSGLDPLEGRFRRLIIEQGTARRDARAPPSGHLPKMLARRIIFVPSHSA
ncbi:hypothetical protein DSM21852_02550 [Methylocystis bryophila]|nr:hypothetical protein DSM21852_02550 [Methylocystis bryophila]